jgi:hypothetical protein
LAATAGADVGDGVDAAANAAADDVAGGIVSPLAARGLIHTADGMIARLTAAAIRPLFRRRRYRFSIYLTPCKVPGSRLVHDRCNHVADYQVNRIADDSAITEGDLRRG